MAKKKTPKKKPAPPQTTLKVEVEMVPASGSPETRTVEVGPDATVHDALVAAKAAFKKQNVFLNDQAVGEGALKTTAVTPDAKIRVMERAAGS